MDRRWLCISLAVSSLTAFGIAACDSGYRAVESDADSGASADDASVVSDPADAVADVGTANTGDPPFDPGSDAGDIVDAPIVIAEAGACGFGCRIVFVTNAKFSGVLNGTAGGDAKCQAAAAASPSADIAARSSKFIAWLSGGGVAAGTRVPDAQYRRPDGVIVASNHAGLLSGTLLAPIDVTELGQTVGSAASVWTGTASDGTVSTFTCSNWSVATATVGGDTGNATSTTSWTKKGAVACASTERLYCFEAN